VKLRRARADDTATLLARAEQFVADGHAREAIDELTVANRRQSDTAIERALVRIRLAAWFEADRTPPPAPAAAVPDLFEGTTDIPEVTARDLDATKIRSAISHHGGLVVRGLLSAEWCARLREGIDRSWEAYDRFRSTKATDPAWFDPADTDAHGLTVAGRAFVMNSGTAYVPDSPRLLFDLLEAFEAAGVKRVVTDYFNEPPALSLVKLAQRRLAPEASGGWHQDAAVYGPIAQTLNFWVPVSRCGDVAPGLEMFPRALDYLVGTYGTEGVDEYLARVDEVGELTAGTPPSRPVFEAGDAAVFDQFLLHQTAASPEFSKPRYGFESWFFAPSTYPDPKRWIPLVY
jgi:hypothetical protein